MDRYTICLALVLASTLLITSGEATTFTAGPTTRFPFTTTPLTSTTPHHHWTTTRRPCGGHLTHNTGVITTPGYPGRYPNHVNCTWQIEVTHLAQIEFDFGPISIESHPFCVYDYLQITAPGMKTVKLCGTLTPEPLLTPGSTATVTFRSDGSVTRRGFNITYTTKHNITFEELASEVSVQRDLVIALNNTVAELAQCSSAREAFSVQAFPPITFDIVDGSLRAPNTRVVYRVGQGLNMTTGTFTCPMSGVYFFSVDMQSPAGAQACQLTIITSNDGDVARADAGDNDFQSSASMSATLHLAENDTVEVNGYCPPNAVNYAQFTGFLLSADSCP